MLAGHPVDTADGHALSPVRDATLLRVLVIDDSESDAELMLRMLRREGWQVVPKRIDTAEQMRAALRECVWDLLLVDYRIPGFGAFEALTIYQEFGLDVPFLIVSGSIGEQTAISALKAGVHDFFLKDSMARFPVAVRRELEEAENRRRKREAEDRLRRQADELAAKNRELEVYAAKLRHSNTELEHFAYVASHDLSEPLRSIAAYCELLIDRYRTGALKRKDGDEFVGYIEQGVDRMQNLINGLLSYSRVIHNSETTAADVAPADVLAGVLASLAKNIDETGAVITYGNLPVVHANAVQLAQIFQNLLSNAIKYRKPGERPRVTISGSVRDGEAEFSVSDNGIGIPSEHWERVFVLFKRLHNQQIYPGLGLGLSITKRLVERHGGRIWVESSPGVGSTFYFRLPVGTRSHADGWVI